MLWELNKFSSFILKLLVQDLVLVWSYHDLFPFLFKTGPGVDNIIKQTTQPPHLTPNIKFLKLYASSRQDLDWYGLVRFLIMESDRWTDRQTDLQCESLSCHCGIGLYELVWVGNGFNPYNHHHHHPLHHHLHHPHHHSHQHPHLQPHHHPYHHP